MTSELASLLFVRVLLNQAGVPLPVVPSLLAAGALAHSRMGLLVPVLATVAGTLVADLVWYGLGRWRGPQALALLGRLSRRAEERFLTHQLGFLFSSRFLPEMNPIAARPRNGRPPRWASSAVTPSGPLSGYGFQNILLATSQ